MFVEQNNVLEMVLGTFHRLSHLIIIRAPGQMLLVSFPLYRCLGTDKAFGHTGDKWQSWVQASTRVHACQNSQPYSITEINKSPAYSAARLRAVQALVTAT